uniref:KRAB-A domain-containing protein 2-like n=1 Tax=Tanacetum cinerariifolium TaxID=118510 RepID=A0A6L2JMV8_TANCI|nr:KRAB-A domain-containing protein 2-like [Tanacetum cinerariifolium]
MVTPAPQDRWSQYKHIELVNIISDPGARMLSRSMPKELGAVSDHECLFVDFLSEEEPKKVFEALRHPGWVDVKQDELNQFSRNKVWALFLAPYDSSSQNPSSPEITPKEEPVTLDKLESPNPFLHVSQGTVGRLWQKELSKRVLFLLAGGPTSLGATSKDEAHPQLSSGHDASADSTAEADPGNSAPNDSIPSQQDQTKSARDGLKTTHSDSGINEESRADDISKKIMLEDLPDFLKDTITIFFTPESPQDESIIVLDESEEEKTKKDDTHATSPDVPEDNSFPHPPSLKSAQIQELMAQMSPTKKISFEVGDETITFDIEKSMRFPPSDDDTCHSINMIDLCILDHVQEIFPLEPVDSFLFEPINHHLPTKINSLWDDNYGEQDLINLILGDLEPDSEGYTKPILFMSNTFEGEKPTIKLKDLPSHLEYAFLGQNQEFPVIISLLLSTQEKELLLGVLAKHYSALAWKVFDIKGNQLHGALPFITIEIHPRSRRLYVSKWVEAEALPTNDARVVVKFLQKLFSRFEVPKALLSDRGTYFCNYLLEKTLKKYGVTHRLATPYHPQTSGHTENANRAIKRTLERTVNGNMKEWANKLDDALWAFRTAYMEPIGSTPFKIVCGKACHMSIKIKHKVKCKYVTRNTRNGRKMKKTQILTRLYGVTPTPVLRRNIFKERHVTHQHYGVTTIKVYAVTLLLLKAESSESALQRNVDT